MRKEGGAMKRLLLLGVGSALMFTMGGVGPARADNGPHVSGAAPNNSFDQSVVGDGCAGCHRIHTAKSADGFLLKTTSESSLCTTCHGSTGTGASTNVVDGIGYENASTGTQNRNRNTTAAALRSGGFSNAMINSSHALRDIAPNSYHPEGAPTNQRIPALVVGQTAVPTAVTSTHTVGATGTAWGNGAVGSGAGSQVALECGSCHDPHGNGNYRILKPMPAGGIAQEARTVIKDDPATTTVDETLLTATNGIVIPDASTKVYTTTDFWQTGSPSVLKIINGVEVTAKVTPDGFIANISDWCTTCHTRYRSPALGRSANTGDAIFTYRHTTTKIDSVGTRNCITCHVAHGSNASAMGDESSKVLQPNSLAAPANVDGSADSRLLRLDNRGICEMCHNK